MGDASGGSEAPRGEFARLVHEFRTRLGLTQEALAARTGFSVHTIRGYEQDTRRHVAAASVDRLAAALELDRVDAADLRAAAGLPIRPAGLLDRFRRARRPSTVWDEVDSEWITMILDDRREIVAWNGLANAVAEMDLGTLSPFHRSLLRMATTKYFDDHLRNWDEIIGRLVSILKAEGVNMEQPGQMPAYIEATIADIIATPEDSYILGRLYPLWMATPPWPEGARNIHRIEWRLSDGTDLSFIGAFRDWSLFDGLVAFDWHAADAATSAWMARAHRDATPVNYDDDWPQVLGPALKRARNELRLSRADLAARSGISASSIDAYESGRRAQPGRDQLLRLCAGLSLDSYRMNALLRLAGYDEEPSDLARWTAGENPARLFASHAPLQGTSVEAMGREADDVPWPCFLIDGRCHVIHANAAAERLTHVSQIVPLPERPGPHLMQLAAGREIRARLLNWPEAVTAILPGRLQPLVLGQASDVKPSADLAEVGNHLRVHEREGLIELLDVWDGKTLAETPRRVAVKLDWQTDTGERLAFHCLLNPWNAFDPYWAMDWHPATPETFAWLGLP